MLTVTGPAGNCGDAKPLSEDAQLGERTATTLTPERHPHPHHAGITPTHWG